MASAASLTKPQKAAVVQLRGVTGCSERDAVELLSRNGWAADRAADAFFDGARKGASKSAAIEAVFSKYQDAETPGKINLPGLEKFFSDLGVDIYSDVLVLVIAFYMGAKVMGVLTKDEFVKGFIEMGVTELSALKARLPALRAQLRDAAFFKRFWAWAYTFNCEEGQKTIKRETAIDVSKMLLSADQWPLAPSWIAFLEGAGGGAGGKPPSRDSWCMLLEFMQSVRPDLSDYDASGATSWPVMLDEFAEFVLASRASGGGSSSKG